MTDLLSRHANPRGWVFSAVATVLYAVLLLPASTLFQRGWRGACRLWAVLGAWLYRLGLMAAIAVGVTSPFDLGYSFVHIWLAFLAFMTMVAAHASSRRALAMLAAIQVGTLLFLAYLFLTPDFFEGRLWLLAVCEWALVAFIAAGTLVLASAAVRASQEPLR